MIKTSIIIPIYILDKSYQEMTQRCIDSLKYGRPDEIILVDDGSPYQEPFRTQNDTFVIQKGTNGGYSKAVNTGLSMAGGEVLIVGNNDLMFTPGWLEGILKPLDYYDISSIRTSDNGYEIEGKITEGDKYGSIFAMKRKVYETIGGMDELFRGYYADLDHRRRAMEAGFKIGKNHEALVEHEAKATYKKTDPDDTEYIEASHLYITRYGKLD